MGAPSEVSRRLQEQCETIALRWYEAIAPTCYATKSAQEIRQDLTDLAGRAIDLLDTRPLDALQAEEIGVELARLHYIQAEALGATLWVLGEQLRDEPRHAASGDAPAGLAALLAAIAAGFFREASRMVLAEQETIRAALVSELEESRRALLEAHQELERRVEERTAQLARINQELRAEVAERRRVEGALRESEDKYRRLIEDMHEVVYAIDRNLRLTYVSPSLRAWLGYEPAEVIGRNIAEFILPEDHAKMGQGVQNLLAGRSQSSEYRLVTKDGGIRWAHTSSNPAFEGSSVVGFHGLMADVTERQLAEEALRASEERWRLLVENAPVLVVTLGRDLSIRYMNRGGGDDPTSVQRLQGTDMLGYVVPEHADATGKAICQVFETGNSSYLEIPVYNRLGQRAWYGAHLGPLRRGEQVTEVMLVAWDITEQRKLAEMKDSLIRDVSHELRTPLAKVQMSLELLAELLENEDVDREKALRVSGFATRSTNRLLETVENILDLSKLEAGMWPYRREAIEPVILIQEAIEYAAPMSTSKGLELEADLPAALPMVNGDRDRLSWVLRNLLYNAIKFSEEGRIVITARDGDGELTVAVSDQGQGILPENLERVFQHFFQEKTRSLGAGVGLAICKTIVEDHGGRIWAESAGRGQGATFRFTLPSATSGEMEG